MNHRTTRSALGIVALMSAAAVAMLTESLHIVPSSSAQTGAGGGVQALDVVVLVLLGVLLLVGAGLRGLQWPRSVEQPTSRRLLSITGVIHTEHGELASCRDRAEAARIVAAVDAERRRIERDLHDGAQQGFVQATLMLGLAADRLSETGNEAVTPLIRSSIETLRAALGELRDLSRGVYPFLLSHEGLVPAVQSLVGRSVVPVALRADPLPRLGDELETTAYFVIAEAVTNALKHAHATQIAVDVRWTGSVLTLTVTDDGVGLAGAPSGSGIRGLHTRVTSVGGTLQTGGTPGTGTTVIARFRVDDQIDARAIADS